MPLPTHRAAGQSSSAQSSALNAQNGGAKLNTERWALSTNPIDAFISRKLLEKHATSAPLCDDAAFLRRATLDITGVIPTEREAAAFLADTSRDKRAKAIDRLLASASWAVTRFAVTRCPIASAGACGPRVIDRLIRGKTSPKSARARENALVDDRAVVHEINGNMNAGSLLSKSFDTA